MRSRTLSALTLLMVALLLAACGSGSSSPSVAPTQAPASEAPASAAPSAEPSEAAAPPEKAEITVGILPIVDVAAVQAGISGGHFAAEGLTVTTEVMQGGAAAIPALVAGDLDIAFGAWPSFLNANLEGIELRAIADGVAATPAFTEILALPDSGLEGNPAGLAGKKVAVNTLANLLELVIRSTLQQAGADPQDVTLVPIPFPEMSGALERGDVDAITAVEPGVTGAKNALGAVVVADAYVGPMEGFPVAGFQVTKAFADANPNTVAAFQRAIIKAAADVADDARAREVIGEYTELPPEVISAVTLPEFRGAIDPAELQRVYDYLVEFGILQEGLDVPSLVLPSP
jgi:NitT/TauT family transport system substrate-binding protein